MEELDECTAERCLEWLFWGWLGFFCPGLLVFLGEKGESEVKESIV